MRKNKRFVEYIATIDAQKRFRHGIDYVLQNI